jgi:hypothetical protein
MLNYFELVLIKGHKDTRVKSGQSYDTITLAEIAQMAEVPNRLCKLDAPALIASTYNAPDARSHAAQRKHGCFHAFVLDVDEGNTGLKQLNQALSAICGNCARIVYSTSSATVDAPKWRAIIPFKSPVTGQEYEQLQQALFASLTAHNITCDQAMKGAAQMSFLPNVPPDKRGEDGTPKYYEYLVCKADSLSQPPQCLLDMAEQIAQRDVEAQLIAAEVAKDRAQQRRKRREHSEMLSPIEQFNADHDLTQMLLEYGWEPRGRACYASPYSQSKGPSVYVYDQRAVSFTSSDAGQLGKETSNGWTTYDAWDVFVARVHGGSKRAALDNYCEVSGYNQVKLHTIVKKWGQS